jgi:hypothetical protein
MKLNDAIFGLVWPSSARGAVRHPGLSQDSGPAGRAGPVPRPDRRRDTVHRRRACWCAGWRRAKRQPWVVPGTTGCARRATCWRWRCCWRHRCSTSWCRKSWASCRRPSSSCWPVPGAARAARARGADRRDRHLVIHFAFYKLLRVPLPWGVLKGSRLVNNTLQEPPWTAVARRSRWCSSPHPDRHGARLAVRPVRRRRAGPDRHHGHRAAGAGDVLHGAGPRHRHHRHRHGDGHLLGRHPRLPAAHSRHAGQSPPTPTRPSR